ncbi:MAG: hypothetical protein NZU63_12500 [Gemmataceae bacterium]|nr:hypothetical protein [Gemmataceae bacterium]
MPVEVICSNCGAKLKAPDAAVGKKAKCGKCRQPVLVPKPTDLNAPSAETAAGPEQFPTLSENENPFDFGTPSVTPPGRNAASPNSGSPEVVSSLVSDPANSLPPNVSSAESVFAFADVTSPRPGNRSKATPRRPVSESPTPTASGSTPQSSTAPSPYRVARERPASNRLLYLTCSLALIALVLGAIGLYVFIDNTSRVAEIRPQARNTTPEDTDTTPPKETNPTDTTGKDTAKPTQSSPPSPVMPNPRPLTKSPSKNKNLDNNAKNVTEGKSSPASPKVTTSPMGLDPGPPEGATLLQLPRSLRTATLAPPSAQPQLVDKVRHSVRLPVALPTVRYFLPPANPNNDDSFVVYRLSDNDPQLARRWVLEQISPVGTSVARVEWDGDNRPVPCVAVYYKGEQVRLYAAIDQRVTIWDVPSKKIVRSDIDPFAGKMAPLKAEIAALYSTDNPDKFVAVATNGWTVAYDVEHNQIASEFSPPQLQAGRVRWLQGTNADSDQRTFVIALAGTLYHLRCGPTLTRLAEIPLGGEVQRSLAIAAEGERFLYVFETGDASQRERAILFSTAQGKESFRLLRWPKDTGDPQSACWSEGTAVIVSNRGGLLLQHDEGNLIPFAFVQAESGPLPYLTTRGSHLWYLLSAPDDPQKTLACAVILPPDDYAQYANCFRENKPLPRLFLTPMGFRR